MKEPPVKTKTAADKVEAGKGQDDERHAGELRLIQPVLDRHADGHSRQNRDDQSG